MYIGCHITETKPSIKRRKNTVGNKVMCTLLIFSYMAMTVV